MLIPSRTRHPRYLARTFIFQYRCAKSTDVYLAPRSLRIIQGAALTLRGLTHFRRKSPRNHFVRYFYRGTQLSHQKLKKLFSAAESLELVAMDLLVQENRAVENHRSGYKRPASPNDEVHHASECYSSYSDRCVFGVLNLRTRRPQSILADNGKQVAAKILDSMCRILVSNRNLTTVYPTQKNRHSAQLRKTLVQIL